jgi:hypothetical protein
MRAGDPLPQLSTKGGEKEVSYCNYHSSCGAELLDVFPTFALRRLSSGRREKIHRRGLLREVSQIVSGRRILYLGRICMYGLRTRWLTPLRQLL